MIGFNIILFLYSVHYKFLPFDNQLLYHRKANQLLIFGTFSAIHSTVFCVSSDSDQ